MLAPWGLRVRRPGAEPSRTLASNGASGPYGMTVRDPVLTSRELALIRAPIERTSTLPARAFTSRGFFELEVARIFYRRWMGVGFEASLPEPGDMRPVEFLGQPLVLVRGDDGVLRAFHNICPYDGCLAVRSEQRAAKAIEVYYHVWRYDLRGRLLAALHYALSNLVADDVSEPHAAALGSVAVR